MRPYKVLITVDVLGLDRPSRAERDLILTFLDNLKENPGRLGDFSEIDDEGRSVQIKIVGKYALTFWTDHAVCEIKVTKIEKAD